MNKKKIVAGICLWYVLMAMVSTATVQTSPPLDVKPVAKQKTSIHKKLEKFIGDEYIAEEISKSKYPYLIAAIGKVESDYRPQAVGKMGEYGMFQIRREIHGEFSDRMESQVSKCESILAPLILKYGLEKGVAKYNGSSVKAIKYSKKVIRIAKSIAT